MDHLQKHITFYGSKDHPILLFLHGFLGEESDFTPFYKHFSKDYYCVGINWMQWCHEVFNEISFDLINQLLHGFIIKYSLKPIHIIGYSMGGRVALYLKNHHPSIIDKFILLSSHHGQVQTSTDAISHQLWEQKLLQEGFTSFLKQWYQQPLFCTLKDHPNLLNSLIEKRSMQDPKILISALKNLTLQSQGDCFSLVDQNSKCLILVGEKDLKYRTLYEKLLGKQFFSRSNLTSSAIILNASHAIHLEHPEACISDIFLFLQGGSR